MSVDIKYIKIKSVIIHTDGDMSPSEIAQKNKVIKNIRHNITIAREQLTSNFCHSIALDNSSPKGHHHFPLRCFPFTVQGNIFPCSIVI